MTLEYQLSNRCIYFTGIMNKSCKAGINYDDVKAVARLLKLPCLNHGGHCSHSKFRTSDEVALEIKEIESASLRTMEAYALIKKHIKETKQNFGEIDCVCGGKLKYVAAKTNGHIWAKCTKCDIAFNE